VGAREDPGGRLVLQRGERLEGVLAPGQPVGPRLDERADERAVLVERRPVGRDVLGKGDRQLGTLLELPAELEERS